MRVVEMGLWVAGPAAAGILADWGADVVKIEAPGGDPMRAFFQLATGSKVDRNPPFDLDNRGKRSREGVWWQPVQSLDEVVQDAQAAAGVFIDAPTRDGGTQRAVASPVEFVGVPTTPTRPAPQLGEHTEAVLREAGLDDAALARLRAAGAISG